jgi:DNA repair protein RadC
MEFGGNSMENAELLELLLSFDSYVIDPTTLGCQLIDEFGSLGAVLASEPAQLKLVENITPRTSSLLKAIQLTLERVMHEPIKDNPVLGSWDALLKFLAIRLQHRKIEELLVIYLDRKNRLIKTDSTSGTVSHVPLYPRNIASRALELFASAVILAHNHPGGNPTASEPDIVMTKKVKNALEALDITLYDHVIISHGKHFSFQAEGLI